MEIYTDRWILGLRLKIPKTLNPTLTAQLEAADSLHVSGLHHQLPISLQTPHNFFMQDQCKNMSTLNRKFNRLEARV